MSSILRVVRALSAGPLKSAITSDDFVRIDAQNVNDYLASVVVESGVPTAIPQERIGITKWPFLQSAVFWRSSGRNGTHVADYCTIPMVRDDPGTGRQEVFCPTVRVIDGTYRVDALACPAVVSKEDGSFRACVQARDYDEGTRKAWAAWLIEGLGYEPRPSLVAAVSKDMATHQLSDMYITGVILFAAQFMHCKNVSLQLVEPPAVIGNRAARRAAGPRLSYRTLWIDPARSPNPKLATSSESQHPGVSLHICRGHFAHYTQEKPLFGKYSGTFWIPQHTKGSPEVGRVVKEYAISEVPLEGGHQ